MSDPPPYVCMLLCTREGRRCLSMAWLVHDVVPEKGAKKVFQSSVG